DPRPDGRPHETDDQVTSPLRLQRHLLFEALGVRQQRTHLAEEPAPCRRQPKPLLLANKERKPQVVLELTNLPAEGRLRQVQPLRGATDVLLFGNHTKVAEGP